MTQCHAQGAAISKCGQYRFDLRRWWSKPLYCLWIMLNPSTADAKVNDRTISKIMGFSERWGFGGLVVVNLFAYRATNPRCLSTDTDDPVGPRNDAYILGWAQKPEIARVFVGWGTDGKIMGRGLRVGRMLQANNVELWCLSINKDGHPKHPLYVTNDTSPKLWKPGCITEV